MLVASYGLIWYSLRQGHQNSAQAKVFLCRAENDSRTSLRQILNLANIASFSNPDLTPLQRQRANDFYTKAINLIPPIKCKGLP